MTVANAKGPSEISSDTDRLLRYARFDLLLPSSERVVGKPEVITRRGVGPHFEVPEKRGPQ